MTRDLSDCQTYTDAEQEIPEPETEDFFNEVVQNSMRTRRSEADLLSEELTAPRKKKAKQKAGRSDSIL